MAAIPVPRRATLMDVARGVTAEHGATVMQRGFSNRSAMSSNNGTTHDGVVQFGGNVTATKRDGSATALIVAARQQQQQIEEQANSQAPSSASAMFPSDPRFWAALLHEIGSHSSAQQQQPPLLLVADKSSGESVTVSRAFLLDFVERWEEQDTHLVTVSSASALRTFRAGSEFWRHVQGQYAALLGADACGARGSQKMSAAVTSRGPLGRSSAISSAEGDANNVNNSITQAGRTSRVLPENELLQVRIRKVHAGHPAATTTTAAGRGLATHSGSGSASGSTMSNLGEGRVPAKDNTIGHASLALHGVCELYMVAQEWRAIVESWDARCLAGRPNAGAPFSAASAGDESNAAECEQSAAAECDGLLEPVGTRPRASAVLDPQTSPDVIAEAREVLRRREQGSRYWTRFMKHWALLEAQYRNYLH